MLKNKIVLFIIFIFLNKYLFFGEIEFKNIKNYVFNIKIPKRWELKIVNNKSFYILNYPQEDAEKKHPYFDPNWIKISFSYTTKTDTTLEEELNKKLKIYDIIIKQEKIKLKNDDFAYSILAESIPNQNELFIIYYDGMKSLLIQCMPSTTKHINEFYEIVKYFSFIYFTPTIENLRFRETPKLDGKFIRLLVRGEKLELLERGKEETINGVKGNWLKLKTEKNEVGWAFDAYLAEVK